MTKSNQKNWYPRQDSNQEPPNQKNY